MIKNGFTINKCNKCVYTKVIKNAYIILHFYVDDMLNLGTNIEVIKSIKWMLSNFDTKDLSVIDVILGMTRTLD